MKRKAKTPLLKGKQMNNGYSICLNKWALDKEIRNELPILLIISSLCAKKGYCYASNNYLAKIFQEDVATISRKIKKLEAKNYIKIAYKKRGCEVTAREIRLTKMSFDEWQNCHSTIDEKIIRTNDENVKENNININIINNKKRESKERKTTRPSFEDVQVYIKEKGLLVNPKKFFDYFEEGNWKDAKGNPVLNWKQKILTWNRFEEKEQANNTNEDLEEERKWARFLAKGE